MAINISNNQVNKRKKFRTNSEINITPMVDVMLVLLVIFMVTSPMLVAGINVDLPETTAAPVTGQDEPLAIDITNKGAIYLNDTEIKPELLTLKLKAITKEKMDSRIFIRGDKNVDYGKVMEIIAMINEAGYNKVALVTLMSERGK